ncbi:autotransporter outer membrane beta-barrel domain-containing protein [Endozoicomonas arenosclerae]|uniref:autotransporter outer membrane beta-barrel domain-containing protein n=1 Tax=Endozoicomonas arenosclerae TaxID=1633495 RepID=UPI000784D8BB|nr:autotransporter outer membrane beta-barrel domain-containing protein [Endozoicomonas arenosclerae]
MSQRTAAFTYSKSVLAFAIASVLSSWASGTEPFPTGQWPPEAKKVINAGETVTLPSGQTVYPTDKSNPGQGRWSDNIEVHGPTDGSATGGGIFINEGTVTGRITEGKNNYNYMINAIFGEGMQVTNTPMCVMNSAESASQKSAQSIMVIGGKNSTAVNQGTMRILGEDPSTTPIGETAKGITVVFSNNPDDAGDNSDSHTGTATGVNNENGLIQIQTEKARGISVSEGEGINRGTISVEATGAYGMMSRIRNWAQSPADPALRNALSINDNLIKVSKSQGYGMFAHDENPAEGDTARATIRNNAQITVDVDGSYGMAADVDHAVIDNMGMIQLIHAGATGIYAAGGSDLQKIGRIEGIGTALRIQNSFAKEKDIPDGYKLKVQPGDYLEGTPAIKTESGGTYHLHLTGGTVAGDMEGIGGKDDTLLIHPVIPAPTDLNGPVEILGNISGFSTIDVSGTGWKALGWISGASKLKPSSPINNVFVSGSELDNARANLKFATSGKPLDVETVDQGKIKRLTLSTAGELGTASGIEGLAIKDRDWKVKQPITDLKRVLIEKDGRANTITASTAGLDKELLQLSFSPQSYASAKPKPFTITNKGNVDLIDFSTGDSRPPMGLMLEAGVIKEVRGNPSINDQITLRSGKIAKASGISRIMAPQVRDNIEPWGLPSLQDGVKTVVTKASPKPSDSYAIDHVVLSADDSEIKDDVKKTLWLNASSSANPVEFLSDAQYLIGQLDIHDTMHFGSVKGVEHIVIKGSGWQSHGFVEDIAFIDVESGGSVDKVDLAPSAKFTSSDPMSLSLAFKDQEYDDDDYFIISNRSPQSIGEVDFSTGTARPNMLYVQDGGNNNVVIKGNEEMADAIYVMSGNIPKNPSGISGIGFEGAGWADEAWQNRKFFGLGKDNSVELIKAIALKPASGEGVPPAPTSEGKTVFLAYTDDVKFKRTTLMSSAQVDLVDFSEEQRPDLNYVQKDGITKEYRGNPNKNDRLVLAGGNFQPGNVDSFKSVVVKGTGWNARGLFSNLDEVRVKGGQLKSLHVSGDASAKGSGNENLNIQTGTGEAGELAIHVKRGQLDELIVGQDANLGDVTLRGGKVTITGGGVTSDLITDAGALETKGDKPIVHVNVGNILKPGSGIGVLSFNTLQYDLDITGTTQIPLVNVFGGAQLGDISGLDKLAIKTQSEDAWSASTVKANKVHVNSGEVEKLKVTNSMTNPVTGDKSFTLVTDGYQPTLTIDQDATVKELILGQSGTLESITNKGALETVRATGDDWRIGAIPDAGKLISETTINKVFVSGSEASFAKVPKANELSFKTLKRALSVQGSEGHDISLHVLSQAKLGEVTGKLKMTVAGKDWQFGTPAKGVESLSIESPRFNRLMVTGLIPVTLPAPKPNELTLLSKMNGGQKLGEVMIKKGSVLSELALGQDSALGRVNNKGTLKRVTTTGFPFKVGLITDAQEFNAQNPAVVYIGGTPDLEAKDFINTLTFQTLEQPLGIIGNDNVISAVLREQGRLGDIRGIDTFIVDTKDATDSWSAKTVMAKAVQVRSGQIDKLKVTNSKTNPDTGTRTFTWVTEGYQPALSIDKDSSLKELALGQSGTLGSITNNGNLETVSVSGDDWQSGVIPDAGKLVAQTTVEKAEVGGSQAKFSSSSPNTLRFKTVNKPLSAFGMQGYTTHLNLLEGARLDQVQDITDLNVFSAHSSWSILKPVMSLEEIFIGQTGSVDSLYSGGIMPASIAGNIAIGFETGTEDDYEDDDFFTVRNKGTLNRLDFSQTTGRPNLMYVQDGGNANAVLRANPKKADVLKVAKGPIPTDHQGFSGYFFSGPGWDAEIWYDQKYFELDSDAGTVDSISVIGVAPQATRQKAEATSQAKSKSIIFAYTDQQPKHLHMKSGTDVKVADFRYSGRPNLTYELAGGTTESLTGSKDKHDVLKLSGGTLTQPAQNFTVIKAARTRDKNDHWVNTWSSEGMYEGISKVVVKTGGLIDKLYVSGDGSAKTSGDNTLSLTTTPAFPLKVVTRAGGSLNEIRFGQQASFGDIKLQGGKVTLDSTQWTAGMITDAGTLHLGQEINLNRVRLGGAVLTEPVPLAANTSLSLQTLTKPLEISGDSQSSIKRMDLFEGSRLSDIRRVDRVDLFGPAKSEQEKAIYDATQLVVNSPFEKVHVGTTNVVPADYALLHSFLAMNTDSKHLSISGSEYIGELHLGDGAKLDKVTQVDNLHVYGKSWEFKQVAEDLSSLTIEEDAEATSIGMKDKVSLDGKRNTLALSFTSTDGVFELTNKGTIGNADFSSDMQRPTLHFIQDGGIVTADLKANPDKEDVLELRRGIVENATGFLNASISTSEGSLEMKNPISLVVTETGKASIVEVEELQATAPETASIRVSLPVDPSSRAAQKSAAECIGGVCDLVITNAGGEITELQLAGNQQGMRSKRLHLLQASGSTGDIKASQVMRDRVILQGGEIGSMTGVDEVMITGSSWTAGVVHDPAIVAIGTSAEVNAVSKRVQKIYRMRSDSAQARAMTAEAGVSVRKVTTVMDSGVTQEARTGVLTLDLKGRQPLKSGKAVTQLDIQSGSTVADIDFSDTSGRGGIEVNLKNGSLANLKANRNKDSLKVTQGIITGQGSGLKEMTVSDRLKLEVNARISDVGTYRQDGSIETVMALPVTQQTVPPIIQAGQIVLGEKAVLDLKGMPDNGGGTSYLFMKADSSLSGQAEVKYPMSLRYTHYSSVVSNNNLTVSGSSMGSFIKGLAAAGQANPSAQKAIETAIDPKGGSAVTMANVSDPLNDWVRNSTNKVNRNPVEVAKIANQMTPDLSGASISSAKASIRQAGNAIGARQSGQRTGISAGDMFSSGNVWLQYAYSDATQDKKDKYYGYEAKTNGFTIGADSDLNDRFKLGVAYTYSKGDVKGTDGSTSKMDTEGSTFSVYSTFEQGPMFVDGRVGYTWGENDGKRYVQGSEIKAKYNVNTWDIGLLGGYKLPLGQSGKWSWIPQIAFNYAHIKPDDYKEKSGTGQSNILLFDKIKSDNFEILELGAGLKLLGDLETEKMTFKPEASLMAYHDFKDDPVTMSAHFAQGGNAFLINGAKREENRYQFGAAVDMETHNNMTFTLSYTYDWMDSYKAHGFIARASYAF